MLVYCCVFVLEVALLFNKYKHPCLHQALYLVFYLIKMSNIYTRMHSIGRLHMQNMYNIAVVYFYY